MVGVTRISVTQGPAMTMMLFIFFCFIGVFIMFFYMMRAQEKFQEAMRIEHAQMRLMLRNMEARLADATTPQTSMDVASATHGPPESLSLGQQVHEIPTDSNLELRFDPQDRRS